MRSWSEREEQEFQDISMIAIYHLQLRAALHLPYGMIGSWPPTLSPDWLEASICYILMWPLDSSPVTFVWGLELQGDAGATATGPPLNKLLQMSCGGAELCWGQSFSGVQSEPLTRMSEIQIHPIKIQVTWQQLKLHCQKCYTVQQYLLVVPTQIDLDWT